MKDHDKYSHLTIDEYFGLCGRGTIGVCWDSSSNYTLVKGKKYSLFKFSETGGYFLRLFIAEFLDTDLIQDVQERILKDLL